MRWDCRSAWAATLLALFAIPQVARAGPIEWTYRSEITYAQDYGSRFAVTLTPDGIVATSPGDLSSVWLFSSTGVARPEPGSFEAEYDFAVTVTITDRASGESGSLDFQGRYSSMWSYQAGDRDNPDAWRWDYEVSSFGDYWDVRGLELGRNRYSVRAHGGTNGSFPFGEMTVAIEPTAATPEPGTLALAGLGLSGVFVRLLRRK